MHDVAGMNFERNHGGAQFSGGFAGGKTTGRFEVEDFAIQVQARSAWVSMQRGSVPEGRSKSLSVPQIFVVETEPRHEQATARRMLMPLQKRQVFLWKSSGPMMFDLISDRMNGFWQLRDAHTESAITLLPAKVVQLSKSLVNPGR